ncbi:hypothetical protein TTHERM_00812960 (macronuclear) [Tetrahymena thermophila SB210]|uniref:Uncharacterized protein n=1 Tax=Tetrahymena thermophila (strain SB210) TaxID=312017 RepID=Q22ST5_TETTS|nr:hypothetical protein TTHERM_00812960 [Tetrahymena thermophila SB210]EAR88379.2 hypothetical protein TTHERM_00812960 [Tetrahymena thermophila SB210]|eukprot:XP_001008624.2 hypothetical protein TTHERM_00812960 [Tetrahymena thermophila SB210]
MIADIYYQQEQAVAMALRLEKKYRRESLYDTKNSKNDINLAELDHSLGMDGLKKINQQYYSVKNLNKSQEKQVPKMNQVDMLFDNVKKTNQQNGFFYYKETQKLQKIISSGQLPYSGGSSQKKIKSKQGSQNQLSRNNISSNQIQQEAFQQEDNYSNSQTHLYASLEKQLNKAASKFSENGEMTFAQLGGFLNHIHVLQHIKYDETSKLSNEEEIINSQQLDNSFSSEMKLHELFWEILCYNQNNESDYIQKINSELLSSVTYFLLNKEKQESSPLSLKDNILILLQSFKPSSLEQSQDGKCQQFPESILDDFILSWERVVSAQRLDQIVKDLTKGMKVKRRKVSFSNSKGSNLVIAQGDSQSVNSGSNQNIMFSNNNAADNSFSSCNRPRVRSQSSSHSSVYKNMKKKENPQDVEQDISNLINRIKRHSEQIGENYANGNNNMNNQTAITVFQGRERRFTASSDIRDNQSDNFLGYQTGKFNCYDDAATIHSLPTYLSKNNNTQSSQNINNHSYNQCKNTNSSQKQPYYQQYEPQGVIQGMHITEVSKDQYEQIQSSNPDYQIEKEVTFGEQNKFSSPHDILRRKTKQINSQMNNLVTPKKKSNQKSQIYESEGRTSISPQKSKEEMRVMNLMKQHEEWKQEIIKKWILDKEDKEYEKQKDECTFQPNLGSSKKFNDNLLKNTKNNVDVVSRLYDYSTPKKREVIQYQSLIEKQCQELGECTFKPQTNSKQKQYQHIQSKISHSPISESSSSQPSAHKNKYSSNQKNKDDIISDKSKDENNLPVKGFDQAVKRMKQGFEKTQEAKARREKIRTGTLYQSNKNKQFKPPSMLERQKPKHSPFYYATITLTNGKHGKISLSEDDDPIQVALNFSKAFQLNKDMTEKLKTNLIEQYKNHMLKLVASQI